MVSVPISFLREANAKIIEHNYLYTINLEKDTIIDLNKKYIKEQYIIIDSFKVKVVDLTNDNNNLKKVINKQKANNNILLGVAGAGIISTIVLFLIK